MYAPSLLVSTYILSNVEPDTNISSAPVGGVAGKQYTLIRFEQPKNAFFPIETTLLGMVMRGRLEHEKNAASPIDVTPSGMLMSASFRHSLNASFLIEVTLSGRLMLLRFEKP